MKKITLGIIGVGNFMCRQHLPNIMHGGLARIKYFCDLDLKRAEAAAQKYQAELCVDDARTVMNDPAVDAVIIGTRSNQHAMLAQMALRHGKSFWCEKPLAMTFGEVKELQRQGCNAGGVYAVGFNRVFAPSMIETKKLFDSIRGGPANIIYRIVDDHRVRPGYIFDMADGGGHLLQECCHIFHQLYWLLEAEPVEIYAVGPLETDNTVVMKFADGSTAAIICGGLGGFWSPKELMEVFCNHNTIMLDQFYELRFCGRTENFIRHFPMDFKDPGVRTFTNMSELYRERAATRPDTDLPLGAGYNPLYVVDKGHDCAMRTYIQCLAGHRKFPVTLTDGLRATVCALKAYDSIRANLPLAIQEQEYRVTGN